TDDMSDASSHRYFTPTQAPRGARVAKTRGTTAARHSKGSGRHESPAAPCLPGRGSQHFLEFGRCAPINLARTSPHGVHRLPEEVGFAVGSKRSSPPFAPP